MAAQRWYVVVFLVLGVQLGEPRVVQELYKSQVVRSGDQARQGHAATGHAGGSAARPAGGGLKWRPADDHGATLEARVAQGGSSQSGSRL